MEYCGPVDVDICWWLLLRGVKVGEKTGRGSVSSEVVRNLAPLVPQLSSRVPLVGST